MEKLQYTIDDHTIAEILGTHNFTNSESAILELVKNAYDAQAKNLEIELGNDSIVVKDDGIGMSVDDIKKHWMHVGKSNKGYTIAGGGQNPRVLAGSKGIGRFALAKLGDEAEIHTKKEGDQGVIWRTDWVSSTMDVDEKIKKRGTYICIKKLREKWGKRAAENLLDFLSKTYNDSVMQIVLHHNAFEVSQKVPPYFSDVKTGINCRSIIKLKYDNINRRLSTSIISDEFQDRARVYCGDLDITQFEKVIQVNEEMKGNDLLGEDSADINKQLKQIGSFTGELYFNVRTIKGDSERFLYKREEVQYPVKQGIILYRNAFSISTYEGNKDWLGLDRRHRKSPAGATHQTGAWRVRANQLSGKIEIDKEENQALEELSNRQGFDEDIYYQLFVQIIILGIKEFERYRQNIIRNIDKKNDKGKALKSGITQKIISNPIQATKLNELQARQLVSEISTLQKRTAGNEKKYKYDVQILNVLATIGLKASSIAHEMRNDRNEIASNVENIISALKEYDMWDILNQSDKTDKVYHNIPALLERNRKISSKILAFMDTMLTETEKRQFIPSEHDVTNTLREEKTVWEGDYSWVRIEIPSESVTYTIAESYVQVIFDNLILNSIQQNEEGVSLNINIEIWMKNGNLYFRYTDNGKGLDKKYLRNPENILEVHETSRKNGHGLGMWIVNNTITMSGGSIENITGEKGFSIEFFLGDYK